MSAPTCLRTAIEACRPVKSSCSRPRQILSFRPFSSTSAAPADIPITRKDITQGFPTPPNPQTTRHESEQAESKNDSDPSNNTSPSTSRSAEKLEEPNRLLPSPNVPVLQDQPLRKIRPPRNVAAAYMRPLKHRPEYGVPTADLQLRSYSVRNVEFMADFALRAAYYLGLPASGPVPLPKLIERWTMPRSNFVHKKSQENFERITLRRLVQIQDGHPEVVQIWLAYLRKHAFYGVGMKANVWDYESLDVGKNMDKAFEEVEQELDAKLATFGWNKSTHSNKSVIDMIQNQGVKHMGVPLTDVREASKTREQRI